MASEFEQEFDPRRECVSSLFRFFEQFAKPPVNARKICTKMRDELRARRLGRWAADCDWLLEAVWVERER
jgi:hypothetical protein